MGMSVVMPDKAQGGGAWLEEPGKYHCKIVAIDEQPESRGGEPIDGTRVLLSVLTPGPSQDRQFDWILYNVNEVDTDEQQARTRQKIAAFLIATGLTSEALLGTGQAVDVDPQLAIDRQIMINIVRDQRKGKENRLQVNFSDVFHVDDPRMEKVAKNEAALRLAPADQRRDPKSFDLKKLTGKDAAPASGTTPAAAPRRKPISTDDI